MPRLAKSKLDGAKKKRMAPVAKKSKIYSMPEKLVQGTVLTDLNKAQWSAGPSIGIGGFGEIYSACRSGENKYDFVIKCEPHDNGPLFVEMHFYMRNAKIEDIQRFKKEHGLKSLGMPYMIGNGSTEINGIKHRFIVMPRYGTDIGSQFIANGHILPEGTVYRLALQMLDVYEFIHSCGYVHADLKAANILLGHGKGGAAQAYLVDYGLASHFTTKEFKPDPKKMHNGTIEYTSRDAHQGVATRRADLEILGYNLIQWLGVQLPWVKQKLLTMPVKVQNAKEEFMSNINEGLKSLFPAGVPVPIKDFMNYVLKMKYDETPKYDRCRKMFLDALKTLKIPNTGDLDFKIKKTTVNSLSPSTSKARGRPRVRDVSIESVDSEEIICGSDDDDSDSSFEKTKPMKAKPLNKVKTTTVLTKKPTPKKASPLRKVTTPLKTSKEPLLPSPTRKRRSTSVPEQDSPNHKRPKSTLSAHKCKSTPLHHVSAKANINISPSVSLSGRPGKTVINNHITPNTRAGKTYEFNFQLNVSADADVIVNLTRKKKPGEPLDGGTPSSTNESKSLSQGSEINNTNSSTPISRVNVRKAATDEDGHTPTVTVKKSKRVYHK